MALEHEDITKDIIGAAYEVYNILGYGFLERVYQKAMQVELELRGRRAEREHALQVKFKGFVVGDYAADLLVDESVIVELKVTPEYNSKDEAQLLNQLKASEIRVGMLINFGKTGVRHTRFVF